MGLWFDSQSEQGMLSCTEDNIPRNCRSTTHSRIYIRARTVCLSVCQNICANTMEFCISKKPLAVLYSVIGEQEQWMSQIRLSLSKPMLWALLLHHYMYLGIYLHICMYVYNMYNIFTYIYNIKHAKGNFLRECFGELQTISFDCILYPYDKAKCLSFCPVRERSMQRSKCLGRKMLSVFKTVTATTAFY